MYIQPRPGYLIMEPHTKRVIPPEGAEVPDMELYWHNRLADGDVVLASPPKIKPEPKAGSTVVSGDPQ